MTSSMKSLGVDLINPQSLNSKPDTSFFTNPLRTKKVVDVDPDVIHKPEVVTLAENMIEVLKSTKDKSEFLKGFKITKNRDQNLISKSTETLNKKSKRAKSTTSTTSIDVILNIFRGAQNTLEVPENNVRSISVPNLNESTKAMVMIFVIGGITPSEIRYSNYFNIRAKIFYFWNSFRNMDLLHKKHFNESNVSLFLGSTHVITPTDYLNELKSGLENK